MLRFDTGPCGWGRLKRMREDSDEEEDSDGGGDRPGGGGGYAARRAKQRRQDARREARGGKDSDDSDDEDGDKKVRADGRQGGDDLQGNFDIEEEEVGPGRRCVISRFAHAVPVHTLLFGKGGCSAWWVMPGNACHVFQHIVDARLLT